jgi:exonuclease III
MDMRFETWNVRGLYRAGSLKTAASERARYNLDLVAVQEVRWVEVGSQPAEDYTFFYVNGNANHHIGTGSFTPRGITTAVKGVEFISERMLYITLRGRW